MDQAVIYSPAKTSMQSGTAKTGYWLLKFKQSQAKTNNPIMGWAGGSETQTQVILKFDTLNEAENYAKEHEISYIVRQPKKRALRIKSYGANYAYNRRQSWTH